MKSREVAGRPSTDESDSLAQPLSVDDDYLPGPPLLRGAACASGPSTLETSIRCRD